MRMLRVYHRALLAPRWQGALCLVYQAFRGTQGICFEPMGARCHGSARWCSCRNRCEAWRPREGGIPFRSPSSHDGGVGCAHDASCERATSRWAFGAWSDGSFAFLAFRRRWRSLSPRMTGPLEETSVQRPKCSKIGRPKPTQTIPNPMTRMPHDCCIPCRFLYPVNGTGSTKYDNG